MKNHIVTISREFGCNGREVGRTLASRLDLPFYDKDLIDLTAKKAGLRRDIIAGADEQINSKQSRLFDIFGYGSSTVFFSEKAISAQAAVIREIADKDESCIMFGRCADYILREYPNILNFFLYAPFSKRALHISEAYNVTEESAEKMVKRVDRQRHDYYKYVTGKNRGDRDGKLLMLDVSALGVKRSVDVLCNVINIMCGE